MYVLLTNEAKQSIALTMDRLKPLTRNSNEEIKRAAILLYQSCMYKLAFDENWKLIEQHLYPKTIIEQITKNARDIIIYDLCIQCYYSHQSQILPCNIHPDEKPFRGNST